MMFNSTNNRNAGGNARIRRSRCQMMTNSRISRSVRGGYTSACPRRRSKCPCPPGGRRGAGVVEFRFLSPRLRLFDRFGLDLTEQAVTNRLVLDAAGPATPAPRHGTAGSAPDLRARSGSALPLCLHRLLLCHPDAAEIGAAGLLVRLTILSAVAEAERDRIRERISVALPAHERRRLASEALRPERRHGARMVELM